MPRRQKADRRAQRSADNTANQPVLVKEVAAQETEALREACADSDWDRSLPGIAPLLRSFGHELKGSRSRARRSARNTGFSAPPEDVPMGVLVDKTKLRCRVERDYQELKGELGVSHFEERSWHRVNHDVMAYMTLETMAALRRSRQSHLTSPAQSGDSSHSFTRPRDTIAYSALG
jgi:SRSO17 transposase